MEFPVGLAMVHCRCLCIVYVTLELNKPIHDLICLPNGLNIYSLCLKSLSLQLSLADGPSISLKQSHCIPACQNFCYSKFTLKVHIAGPHFSASIPLPRPSDILVFQVTLAELGAWLSTISPNSTTEKSILSTNILPFFRSDCIPET